MKKSEHDAYIQSDGTKCPYCGGAVTLVVSNTVKRFGNRLHIVAQCTKCPETWTSIFTLSDAK